MRAPAAVATGLGEVQADVRGDSPLKTFYSNFRGTFPDLHPTLEDMIAEGGRVVTRLTLTGTHPGSSLGFAPPARKVTFRAVVIAQMANSRIVHGWNSIDQLSKLRQMGALPANVLPDHFLLRRA